MHPRIAELVAYLDAQHADLEQAVNGIPPERRTTIPPIGGWSVAQVLEHLAILEARLPGFFRAWLTEAKAAGLPRETDASSILPKVNTAVVIDRSRKIASPVAGVPTGNMSADEASRKLVEIRQDIKSAIAEGDGLALEQIVKPHPAVGPINFYQWIGTVAAHMKRHADQIREIGASLQAAQH